MTLRKTLSLLAACAFLAALPAHGDELQDAAKLFKAGQYQQALERVNKALAAKPRDPQGRFLKGLIFTEQGNTREAIDIFTRLTQDYPELPEPYINLAVIYASQGQYEKARMSLEQSIRTHPSYATAYENLGDVYAKLASQAYDKALQLDSSNAGAQNKLSLARDLVGPAGAAPKIVIAQKSGGTEKAAEKPATEKPVPANPATEKTEKLVLEKPAAQPPATGKPAAEKPAAQVQAQDASEAAKNDVVKALNGWAQAWAKKDVNTYLDYYAKDFKTPGGESRADWEKSRRTRIDGAKSIAVSVLSPKVKLEGSDRASVNFRQNYSSDKLKTSSPKTITMVKSNGRWLIQQEKVGS